EGTLPGSYSENSVMSAVQRAGIAWNILKGAGIPGVRDVYVHPITNGVNIVVQIRKAYQGQPKQIAAALWGNSAAQYRYKHVFVVDDDIDISSYEQIDWALAHRMNAGEDGLVVFPGIFGSPIDPSTPMEARGGPSGATSASRPRCVPLPRTRRAFGSAGPSSGSTNSEMRVTEVRAIPL